MTTWRRPTYCWADPLIDDVIEELSDELMSGLSDEARNCYVQDFLAAVHQRWPDVVWLKNPPPKLRIVN